MSLAIPTGIIYAGLFGTLLALLVATYQQNWQLRVFLLLALRLAIGWHFLFEGLNKIHSHWIGPTETNKPFSSEIYFLAADGPFGDVVRKKALGDVDAIISERITPNPDKLKVFAQLSLAEQAALCPEPIAKLLEQAVQEGLPKINQQLEKLLADANAVKTDESVKKAQAAANAVRPEVKAAEEAAKKAETEALVLHARAVVLEADLTTMNRESRWAEVMAARAKAKQAADQAAALKQSATQAANKLESLLKKADDAKKKNDAVIAKIGPAEEQVAAVKDQGQSLKASYARWLYGADRREGKVKYVSVDVPQTVPERLAHIKLLTEHLNSLKDRQELALGQGYTHEQKRTTAAKNDLTAAKNDLVADAEAFVKELVEYAGGKMPLPAPKPIVFMDHVTMWTLTIAGACILFGFLTPVACLVAAGFLVLTYLSHPPFPWLPLPPNTEGNPLFINKNVIECLGLLLIAAHPTGRWLGLDAIWTRLLMREKSSPVT